MSGEPAFLPLAGLRILDFTRILSGPYCTLLLADLGADVIKVERCDGGDDTRSWGPTFLDPDGEISTYFAALNRGKLSVAIDLNQQHGPELVADLATQCDAVVENFRPGVAARLGIDHDTLSRRNPAMITCSITGFGDTGGMATSAATEIVVEALSGLMEITGPVDGPPVRFGIAMTDIAAGLTASTKMLAALLQARKTGKGMHVQASLYATAIAALGTSITAYTATGIEPTRWGSHHPAISPYGGFPTADGFLITGVLNDDRWSAFCDALEVGHLAAEPSFETNSLRLERRKELEAAIAEQCAKQPTSYWLDRLRERGLLGAPVRKVGEAVNDGLIRELDLLLRLDGFPNVLAPKLDGARAGNAAQRVPRLGEDTRQVLRDLLGMQAVQLNALADEGCIRDSAEIRATIGSNA